MRRPTAEGMLLQAIREVPIAFQRGATRKGFDPRRSVYVVVDVRHDVRDLAAEILRTTADLDEDEANKEVRRGIADAKRRRTAFVVGGVLETTWVVAWFQKRAPDQVDTMTERLSSPADAGFAHLLALADGGRTIHQLVAIAKTGAA